jgi:hypothetical protein
LKIVALVSEDVEPKTSVVPESMGKALYNVLPSLMSCAAIDVLCCSLIFGFASSDVVTKDATIGPRIETIEKKNRAKREAKGELTPPKFKKIKVSQDTVHTYDTFVMHGRRLKRQPKKYVE